MSVFFFLFLHTDDLEWSECSRECGGGIQWRLNSSSGEIVRRSCNEQACHNEVCLKGISFIAHNCKLVIFILYTLEPLYCSFVWFCV